MSVVAQLPPEMGGASGKVKMPRHHHLFRLTQCMEYMRWHILTQKANDTSSIRCILSLTYSMQEHFGLTEFDPSLRGLELMGIWPSKIFFTVSTLCDYSAGKKLVELTPRFVARAFNSEHQVNEIEILCIYSLISGHRWNSSTSVPCVLRKTKISAFWYL